MSSPEQFVNRRIEEERMAKPESRRKPHRRIGRYVGCDRRARTQLTRVGEVSFVKFRGRNRGEHVYVEIVDLRRTLDAVCRIAISRNIEGLVRVLRVIEIVGDCELVRLVQIEISLAQQRIVPDQVWYRQSFIRARLGFDEVNQRNPLTLGGAVDQKLVSRIRYDRSGNRAGSCSYGSAQVGPRQVFVNAFK